ncbi:MAG TPA: biliverdin-producing heme oxygenase [Deltaproteobacteria bacterium]|nr:biliverdin-producing heme oxygenase [Deltaproteobacteria bacterium]
MTPKDVSTSENQSIQIMTRLKEETKAYHSKLEALPYFKALIEHILPLECYVNQLRALAVIHGVLENEMATSQDERVVDIWENGLRKLPLLEDDLAFFKPRVVSDASESIQAALAMTEKIRLKGIEKPTTLLGYLYVLEGSTLGNHMHRPDITATFHLNALDGCGYYSSYRDQVQTHWNRFSKKVNGIMDDPSLHNPVIEAAHEAFSGLEVLYTFLYPLRKTNVPFHVTRINPEAGNHPIPEDEREIEAALRASDRGWAEFPYYEKRYGERGKRFSDSDACWLVTLTALDQESLKKQMDWLLRVLATRGMPSLMLEKTLCFLYNELAAAVPEKTAMYEKLRGAADALKETRLRDIQEKDFQKLAGEFGQAVGPEMAASWKNTGELLVAAVADERNGTEGAVASVQGWLTDVDRFSGQWILAVNEILQKAEKVTYKRIKT